MHKMVEVSISFAKFGAKEDAVKWEISLFPSERTKAFLCSCIVEKLTQVLGPSKRFSPGLTLDFQ